MKAMPKKNGVRHTIRVRPLLDYHLVGTNVKVSRKTIYVATIASNIPDYKERGLVFVKGILLDRSEYRVIDYAIAKRIPQVPQAEAMG